MIQTRVQFVRFCLVGILNTAITYVVFYALFHGLRLHYLAASAIGYLAGLANSYFVNRSWTFRGFSSGSGGEMGRFVVVNAVALAANLGALRLLVEVFHLHPDIAQIAAIAASISLNFAGNKLWTFRAPTRGDC